MRVRLHRRVSLRSVSLPAADQLAPRQCSTCRPGTPPILGFVVRYGEAWKMALHAGAMERNEVDV